MTQQLNLLNPALLRTHRPLGARHLAFALGASVLLCTGYSVFVYQRGLDILVKSEQLRGQLKAETAKMGALAATLKAPDKTSPAQQKVLDTERQANTLTAVFNVLNKSEFGFTGGYAAHYRAFAQSNLPGVWLTEIDLFDSGKSLRLKGKTISAELLPSYLQRLQKEPTLQGLTFTEFQIRHEDTDQKMGTTHNILAFDLSSGEGHIVVLPASTETKK